MLKRMRNLECETQESLNWKCHLHSLEVVVGIWEQKEVGKELKPLNQKRIFDDGVIGVEQWKPLHRKSTENKTAIAYWVLNPNVLHENCKNLNYIPQCR